MYNASLLTLTLSLILGVAAPARADEPAPAPSLCSDLSPPPREGWRRVGTRVIFEEVVAGVFPGALFPKKYARDGEVPAKGRYVDDRGRLMSRRAAIAVLENAPASQDLILAWRANTEAESQAYSSMASGMVGVATGDAMTMASSMAQIASAGDNLTRLDGGAESAFAQAVCVYNSAAAARRARTRAAAR